MSNYFEYLYYDAPTFQAISLPYRSGRFSMDIFLPKPESNLAEFQKQLTARNWQVWSSRFNRQQVFIQMPRFEMQYEIRLNTVLQKMGMKIAFNARKADFRNLTSGRIAIEEVKHKTFVNVNEEGTEAAAATVISISRSGIDDSTTKMIVDRPFFFAISDRQTGTILFMGTIQNPAAK